MHVPPSYKRVLPAALPVALAAFALAVSPAVAAPSPDASLTADPASPVTAQAVTFRSTSTARADRPIVKHEWDLDGNGTYETNTGATAQVTRSFPTAGVVVVALRVSDTRGKPDTAALPVTVRSEGTPPPPPPPPGREDTKPPRASFIFSPSEPRPGQLITFASTSSDPGAGGGIAQESWDLSGDGVFGDAVGRTATATLPAGGHSVSLRVTDRAGLQSLFTQSIDIRPLELPVGATQLPGARALRLMRPFPVIRMAGRYTTRGVNVRLFTIAASSRATVRLSCRGRDCPFRKRTIAPLSGRAVAARRLRLRAVEGWLGAGVRLVVTVTRPGELGKYTRFRIRRLEPPARVDRCMVPGSGKPTRCPGA